MNLTTLKHETVERDKILGVKEKEKMKVEIAHSG
jgi:hypothetical protein